PSGGLANLKPSFKSVGSSCCPHRYPLRENGRHIFAEHDLETVQKICRFLGETEIKENLLISPIQIQYPENNHAYPATAPYCSWYRNGGAYGLLPWPRESGYYVPYRWRSSRHFCHYPPCFLSPEGPYSITG
ncbi:MAG: hypothetical protein K940chlam9_01143, partial [Chlamydiae bacterium]|nr:hypothetical protein [Chlamydiota bacterium]